MQENCPAENTGNYKTKEKLCKDFRSGFLRFAARRCAASVFVSILISKGTWNQGRINVTL